MSLTLEARRSTCIDICDEMEPGKPPLSPTELERFEAFDLVYRSLCALMFNYVPTSGHPGGSISSGPIVTGLLFDVMDYDPSDPECAEADIVSYAAGHKALGLYAMWALRDELLRIGAPDLLPRDPRLRLRLEDLLGFRRNPATRAPLFNQHQAKALDGHPTPATPFIKLATGASGVGVPASLGLALAALDYYGENAPRVHIVEGEGGMTPGRVSEAMAAAGTSALGNVVMHVDWNQASIDSNRVCRDETGAGDYVQWDPIELAYLHDWNVIRVPDGRDYQQVIAAQRHALQFDNGQPTAVVYRTTKGWGYGVEGKASHGAGHKLCAESFKVAVEPLLKKTGATLPGCDPGDQACRGGKEETIIEGCFFEALGAVRQALEGDEETVALMAKRLTAARARLQTQARSRQPGAPRIEALYEAVDRVIDGSAATAAPEPGSVTTLRGELGRVFNFYNEASGGALLVAAADLLGSTSVNLAAKGFPAGYFNARDNTGARLLSIGGICEDAISGLLSGVSSFGQHIGIGSSYGAFLAPLGHIAARLHAIGNQGRQALAPGAYRPFFLVCAHAGLKTGEDGPTHADPQSLQLLQGNFPPETMITLTPWEPQEISPLVAASLQARPAVIAPFVTRPNETVLDRPSLGLAPAVAATSGLYALRQADGEGDGTVVLQGSGVTYAFVQDALPRLIKDGFDLNVYYVASAELFDLQPLAEQRRIFPEERARQAIGITGFTLATMYRWITSEHGRAKTLHPFRKGHFLGSGQAHMVLTEAGLDGESQYRAIAGYVKESRPRRS
jgi:transketolase